MSAPERIFRIDYLDEVTGKRIIRFAGVRSSDDDLEYVRADVASAGHVAREVLLKIRYAENGEPYIVGDHEPTLALIAKLEKLAGE